MVQKMVRYRIAAARLAEVEPAIAVFVAAVGSHEPATEYRSFRGDKEGAFVHFMSFPDEKAEESHRQAEHTRRFVEVLYPACEEGPEFTDLTLFADSRSTNDR